MPALSFIRSARDFTWRISCATGSAIVKTVTAFETTRINVSSSPSLRHVSPLTELEA
ncbi:hypothetical protein PC116_g1414 [Phytophthora cactorum]|uniref:Uncharacterized protein n=1 Tax=Phytophthora cactorum TaxID=29920 RepID=A0A8T1EI03_9STRA|nr:hypothetical protein PC114_g3400 [Phytophthora cactorum]KAG2953091.1 hypothetical protein PC117_g2297 [Phytophthora cactorum]KAG3034715.1 hypothetical protein PC120_g1241 [Phytophthora cactorum]KAG3203811.1 hypothetical protein PC128_g2385 [Phytophthora cactorum]KAG4250879.1 hypothetical protein PC116_g1414 [Phytophthora cactorum]